MNDTPRVAPKSPSEALKPVAPPAPPPQVRRRRRSPFLAMLSGLFTLLLVAAGVVGAGIAVVSNQSKAPGPLTSDRALIIPKESGLTEIAELLPTTHWPDRRILVAAVSVGTGTLRAFTREDGVPLLDAVGASCAVPGVWPPVALDGDLWLDGAVASNTNVPLATGAGRVVVLAPMPPAGPALERELSRLGERVRSYVLTADADATRSFGDNPFDPRTAATAAREGLRQGTGAAADILALLDHEGVEQS